mmetsp:Transcript_34106/g.55601  ORF Transcript_34106/g.55601 Transcript_34106/m.55601 type:complete len:313 (+) Transcript_34106:159-1097(+)|eukprot:CAMPEP_0202713708 /NCGR_PEP_ID=MMETSP1385-20130828/58078_1 /ASSEMBLY_ACC=CAM_ASM_000861 /TAXON_ID=933848 /ORGANISM="Elphidium margaritaceum" /LENGTH=312 /DNA_ID=CAMNT_0049374149 /DNA_START=159 /DNA_END=1097 /DNA_ORIENTATION=-
MNASSKLHQISSIVYAPWRYGQRKAGVESGSASIRSLVHELASSSCIASSASKTVLSVQPSHIANNEQYHRELFETRVQCDRNTLVIGGDHSVAIGSLLGSLHAVHGHDHAHNSNPSSSAAIRARNIDAQSKRAFGTMVPTKKLGVIWIDAHADINTLESSESKNVHGCPLAFCTGIDRTWQWVNDTNLKLDFADLYYWGIRDLDNFEIDIIDNYGIKVCSDKEECMAVIDEYEHIHTSLDVDALDPKYAPSTGTPVEHGLELKDVLDYLYYLKFCKKSMCFDLVEYNPDIGTDQEKITTKHTIRALLNAIL